MRIEFTTSQLSFASDMKQADSYQVCTLCQNEFPSEVFLNPLTDRALRYCLDCRSKPEAERKTLASRLQYEKNRLQNSIRMRCYNHGITKDEFLSMLEKQNNACAICSLPFSFEARGKGSQSSRPCVDHNHETGKVRGLLCSLCNTGLGSYKDREDLLFAAIEYLRQYNS